MPPPVYFPGPVSAPASTLSRIASGNTAFAGLLPYAALIFIFIAAGLTGHDPWKADEAYIFGVIQHMLDTSDWLVPTLAGEPFMEKPPLFYWVASSFAYLLSGYMPLHDAARLTSGFFMLVTCWAVGAAARLWWGAGMGRYAVMAVVACLGTLVQSHMMMPDVPLLTGFALSALGFATVLSRPVAGGVLLGLGAGVGFLSKGVLGPAVMGATALLLPLLFRQWRMRAYWRALGVAAVVSAPFLLIWPAALYLRSPPLFIEWFWMNNIGRFLGFSVGVLGAEHLPWFWTETIPWFTFPGLPIAMWMLWQRRRTALSEPATQYALVAFGVLMAVLAMSSSGRCVYGWPLMVPIAILAAPGARRLPKVADGLLAWGSVALFAALSFAVWAAWAAMMLNGAPPAWPVLLRVLPAEFMPRFHAADVTLATLATLAAAIGLRALWRKPGRGLTVWVLGITLSWTLLTTLWMPWLDFAKSYRSVFAAMPIPVEANCIASMSLGEGERAMLRYVTGRNPVRVEVSPTASCSLLLVQREVAGGEPDVDPMRWREVWRGSRPGVTNERFWLFQLDPQAMSDAVDMDAVRKLGAVLTGFASLQ